MALAACWNRSKTTHKNSQVSFLFVLFCLRTTLGNYQGLFLALCSGVTLDSAHGTYEMSDFIPYLLYDLWPMSIFLLLFYFLDKTQGFLEISGYNMGYQGPKQGWPHVMQVSKYSTITMVPTFYYFFGSWGKVLIILYLPGNFHRENLKYIFN